MSTSDSTLQPGRPAPLGPPIHVAFVWHMHQPYYRSAQTGAFQLPWARLHAVKDYLDMVEILADHPAIHQTFNLVPSLVEQIEGGRHRSLSRLHIRHVVAYGLSISLTLTIALGIGLSARAEQQDVEKLVGQPADIASSAYQSISCGPQARSESAGELAGADVVRRPTAEQAGGP